MVQKNRVLKLTKAVVSELLPNGRTRQVYRDTECRGLVLRVGRKRGKSWIYDYRDAEGKRQTYTFADAERVDPGEARKRVREFGTDPAGLKRETRHAVKAATDRTLEKFLEGDYWAHHLSHRKSGEATKARIRAVFGDFLETDIQNLEPTALARHRAARLKAGVKPQTVNRDRTSLLALLNKAVELRVIESNPLEDPAYRPVPLKGDDKRVRWLGMRDETEDRRERAGQKVGERTRFLEAIADDRTPEYLRHLCLLAMNTGLRRGELLQLRWEHVSLSRKKLTVDASTAKTTRTRHIDLNTHALAVLRARSVERERGEALVFPSFRTGAAFNNFKRSWRALVDRAQLVEFTFHDLRHDFASRLVQAGADLYVVKDLLGHSTIQLTERYAHLKSDQRARAVALLEEPV